MTLSGLSPETLQQLCRAVSVAKNRAVKQLDGKLLTIVDATIQEQTSRDAVKSLMREAVHNVLDELESSLAHVQPSQVEQASEHGKGGT